MLPAIVYINMPSDKYGIKCPYSMDKPEGITVHNTANYSSARNEVDYMQRNNSQTSYHFAVDDVEIVNGSPLSRNTWHAGDGLYGKGNRKTISIEICYSHFYKIVNGETILDDDTWNKQYRSKFEKAQDNAAKLVAYLLHEYGWGMDTSKVFKHQDFSDKYCPRRTLSDYGWDYFLDLVKSKYKEMYIVEEDEEVTQADFNKMMDTYLKEKGLPDYVKNSDRFKIIEDYMSQKLGDNPSKYAKDATAWSKSAGMFKGDDKGNYNWILPLTREDYALLEFKDRYYTIGDIKNKEFRETILKLVDLGLLKGKSGDGLDRVIDLPKDIVRMLVILDRANVFQDKGTGV